MGRYASQARDDLAAMIALARAAQPGEIPNMAVVLTNS